MPAPVLQFKRGNAGVAGTVPALRPGEPAISLNNFDFFIGIDTSVANNKFFGSHRYWGREDGTNALNLKLVDKDGTNYVAIKAPNTLGGNLTYTLPGIQGASSSVLTNDGSGNLVWASGSANPVFTGIATFNDTTDNTLGNPDTGAVQIDGGLGVNKNVTIGAGLSVTGQSHFIGTATFYGGQINLGDSDTDDIVVAGEFKSNLIPSDDATYNLGNGSKRWNNASFAGVVTATTFTGALSGNASSADQVKTVTASDTNANYYVTFVDANNGSAINESVYTDDGIYYNPGTNTFTTQHAAFTGNVNVSGATTVTSLNATGDVTLGDTSGDTVTVKGTATFEQTITGTATTATRATLIDTTGTSDNATYYATFVDTSGGQTSETLRTGTALSLNASTGNVKSAGDIVAGSGYLASANGTRAMYMYDTSGNVAFQGKVIANRYRSSTNASDTLTFSDLDATFAQNISVTGITTTGTLKLFGTSGIGITGISASTSLAENSDDYLPTQRAVKAYVDAVDVTLGLNADSGGPSTVSTAQTLTISGTASEVETSVSGQTVTIGLPNDVVVGTSLSAPTIRTGTIQSSNTGATAITIAANDVTIADDLTVQGNLYVNGNTTQVNTSTLTVEDRTIELGRVDGSVPASSTTWDLGVLFNYNASGAKKSAVVWEHSSTRFQFASVLGSDTDGTDANTPQLSVTTFAPIEIGALWVTDCAGTSQVISCTGTERFLENITVDAGNF